MTKHRRPGRTPYSGARLAGASRSDSYCSIAQFTGDVILPVDRAATVASSPPDQGISSASIENR